MMIMVMALMLPVLGYINETMEQDFAWVGMAPEARLVFTEEHAPWSYAMQETKDRNGFINTWSLGNYTKEYSIWMRDVDTYLDANHDVLALISAGNGFDHQSIAHHQLAAVCG